MIKLISTLRQKLIGLFRDYRRRKMLKKLKQTQKALLSLVLDGTWKKEDPFFLQQLKEIKEKISQIEKEADIVKIKTGVTDGLNYPDKSYSDLIEMHNFHRQICRETPIHTIKFETHSRILVKVTADLKELQATIKLKP